MQAATIEKILSRLFEATRILILTHVRPDGDALGSAFGMRSWLQENGKNAVVFLAEAPPDCYKNICQGALIATAVDYRDFDTVVILDCGDDSRICCPPTGLPPAEKSVNIDHHTGNNVSAQYSLVAKEFSSTCEICAAVALHDSRKISAETATFFYLGMMTDTGCFKFSNTNGRVMRMAADLLDAGVELEKLVNAVYFSSPLKRLQLESDIVSNHLKMAFDNRFAYAYISDELLAKHNFDIKESENIIDIIRSIDSVITAALIYRKGGAFKISLRSKDSRFPILGIAKHFGGGGHPLAGGCSVETDCVEKVEALLLAEMKKVLD